MGLEGNTVRNLEGRKKSPTLLITTTSSKWLRLSHKKNKKKGSQVGRYCLTKIYIKVARYKIISKDDFFSAF